MQRENQTKQPALGCGKGIAINGSKALIRSKHQQTSTDGEGVHLRLKFNLSLSETIISFLTQNRDKLKEKTKPLPLT